MKLGFLVNGDSEEDETSDSDWISIKDGEEGKKEISLFDSSSEAEIAVLFLCTMKTTIIGYRLNNITIQINLVKNCKTCVHLGQQPLLQ